MLNKVLDWSGLTMPKLWVAVSAVSAVSAFRRFGVSALYKSFGISHLAKLVLAGNLRRSVQAKGLPSEVSRRECLPVKRPGKN